MVRTPLPFLGCPGLLAFLFYTEWFPLVTSPRTLLLEALR